MTEPDLKQKFVTDHAALLQNGDLLTSERLKECYALFRTRFGPEVLIKHDGEALLQLMHGRPSKDSLVYWLEFKHDQEFPTKEFGSISGGSSLKFGLYWRQESSEWVTGGSRSQTPVSVQDAVAISRRQRDQLVKAAELLDALPQNASDAEYLELQKQLDQLCGDISGYAWGHKYLSLLFPDKLDDYHNPDYQQFHLPKLLQVPVAKEGLYATAGQFVAIARELNVLPNHLTTVLNHWHPRPHKYWRVGTKIAQESIWDVMKGGNFVAIGWGALGDLSQVPTDADLRSEIRQRFEQHYKNTASVVSRKAGEIRNFVAGAADGDFVVAGDGGRIIGIGRLIGPYSFDPADSEAPHRRPVEWLSFNQSEMPVNETLQTTFVELEEPANIVHIERQLLPPFDEAGRVTTCALNEQAEELALNTILYGPPGTGKTYMLRKHYMERFTERQATLTPEEKAAALVKDLAWWEVIALALLDLPGCIASVADILAHPLVQARLKLSSNKNPRAMLWASLQIHTKADCPNVKYTSRTEPLIFFKDKDSTWSIDVGLVDAEAPELRNLLSQFRDPNFPPSSVIKRYRFTTFHQSFSYEDFVEGIKPRVDEAEAEQIAYEIKPGVFREICAEAAENPDIRYALFIDEINRGNVAGIFGELITLIEDDKRIGAPNELKAVLPYSRTEFGVPSNLHIIGTMNTADRSVEALDTALRRRFTFQEMTPDSSLITNSESLDVDLRRLFDVMNARIEKLLDRDHCIGHAYLIGIKNINKLRATFANKIIPLLREYFYGNPAKVGMVLGSRFVKRSEGEVAFALGDWGADSPEEKVVFTFADVSQLNEEDFQSIYAEAGPGI